MLQETRIKILFAILVTIILIAFFATVSGHFIPAGSVAVYEGNVYKVLEKNEYFSFTNKTYYSFSPNPISFWYKFEVYDSTFLGIYDSTPGIRRPDSVEICFRFFTVKEVPDWGEDAVRKLVEAAGYKGSSLDTAAILYIKIKIDAVLAQHQTKIWDNSYLLTLHHKEMYRTGIRLLGAQDSWPVFPPYLPPSSIGGGTQVIF